MQGMTIEFPPLIPGTFLRRLNRFEAEVLIEEEVHRVHVPSPGRLTTAVAGGTACLLRYDSNPRRKLPYSLYVSRPEGHWVIIDSMVANHLMKKVLSEHGLPGLPSAELREIRAEPKWGHSRFDFVATDRQGGVHLVEVKAVNDAEDGVARFPDAPTARGVRHVRELQRVQEEGVGYAWIFFVVLRDDAAVFAPHEAIDPAFALALRQAVEKGVRAWAVWSDIGAAGMKFKGWSAWVPS
ncbi:MAG: DNA/RNA nuclease SfsA [Alicyclobacillaceae bacterium]|nr:DNA/RNA nuclease SfsA [Alicyclobacillaceae bacterium]